MTTIRIPAPAFPPVRDRKTGKLKPVNPWQFSTCRSDSVLKLEQPPEALKHHPEA